MGTTKNIIQIKSDAFDYFYYDETSPTCLRWKVERRCGRGKGWAQIKPGDSTSDKVTSNSGYYSVYYNAKNVFVHRIIWFIFNGEIPEGYFVDHKNRNRTDNRIENLQLVTRTNNNQNKTKRKNASTDVLGVCLDTKISCGREYKYYVARATDLNGVVYVKTFSVLKFGEDQAFNMAKKYRAELVRKLNQEGCNYPIEGEHFES